MTVSDASSEPDVRLPRGRHGIAAATVAASQRERLMRAVVKVVGERGWSETRIADVVAEAAVSRRTFYEMYDGGLEACFIDAVQAGFAQLIAVVTDRSDAGDLDFEGRVRRFFATYLELLEATPGAMRALHVEAVRATEGIRAMHDSVIEEIARHLLFARFGEVVPDLPAGYGVALVAGFEHLLGREIRTAGEDAAMAAVVDDATAIAVRALT